MKNIYALASIVLFLSVATSAQAATLRCTNADATLIYSASSYGGGAPPFPGMEIGRVTWNYAGVELYRRLNYVPCETGQSGVEGECPAKEKDIIDADLITQFVGTKKVLSTIDLGYGHEETYLQSATLSRKSGKVILPQTGMKRFSDFMLCHSVQLNLP